MVMQHKCIEPLGESKSDFQIFKEISMRLGLGQFFCEGETEFGWCQRLFEATDLPKALSWEAFLKKGYYVVPALPENRRDPVAFRWYAENRKKDVPELAPMPCDYTEEYGMGLQTQSGKIEFECSSLKRFDPDDSERPVVCTYIPSWEGPNTTELFEQYPLQLITPHPRFSFHTMADGKDSFINDIDEHRAFVNGYYYLVLRINPLDARARGLEENNLVEIFNDRGSAICAARLTERIRPGTLHSYESSAVYDPLGAPGASTDRGGCVNLLTPSRMITKNVHGMAANSCLVEIRKWNEEV